MQIPSRFLLLVSKPHIHPAAPVPSLAFYFIGMTPGDPELFFLLHRSPFFSPVWLVLSLQPQLSYPISRDLPCTLPAVLWEFHLPKELCLQSPSLCQLITVGWHLLC